MKKLTIVITLLMVTVSFANAQSNEKKARFWVTNTGVSTINVMVQRYENSLADSSVNYFCWDACFVPAVGLSGILPINPGDTTSYFYAVYDTYGGTGTSSITYCFYVAEMPMDSACPTVLYGPNNPSDSVYGIVSLGSVVGVEKHDLIDKNELGEMYPNPAEDFVSIAYSLKQGANNGYIIIRNLLGSEVYSIALSGSSGEAIIQVDKFDKGIYLSTLVVDNEVFGTTRLVVTH